MKRKFAIITAVCTLVEIGCVAQDIKFDASIGFPTSQGWTRKVLVSDTTEVRLENGNLVIDEQKSPLGYDFFVMNADDVNLSVGRFLFEVDVQILKTTDGTTRNSFPFFATIADSAGRVLSFAARTNGVQFETGSGSETFDINLSDTKHLVRIEVDDGLATLRVDGKVYGTRIIGPPIAPRESAGQASFGDGTSGGSSSEQVGRFVFRRDSNEVKLIIGVAAVKITWISKNGVTYRVQSRMSGDSNSRWTNIGEPIPGDGGEKSFTEDSFHTLKLFRVVGE